MSYKVLHIIDCFLPETMNWLEKLLEESSDVCEHHIYADYYIRSLNKKFHYADSGIHTNYPIPIPSKIKNWINRSANFDFLLQYIQKNKIQIIHFHFGNVAIQYKTWIQK